MNKEEKKKCKKCYKSISLMSFKCRCENNYCIKCRYPRHLCTFDYKKFERNRLFQNNKKIENIKIIKI